MELLEIYVLCESRSATVAQTFLQAFLPERTAATDEYPFPEFIDPPVEIIRSFEELAQRLENDEQKSYAAYWNSTSDHGPRQAMLFYLEDGSMIAGLVVQNSSVNDFLLKLARRVNGRYGYVCGSQPPPATSAAFIDICRNSTLPCLVDGQLRCTSTALD